MGKLKAPCFKNGKDCTKRKVGCRKDCEEWQQYEKRKAEYKEQLRSIYNTVHDADRVIIDRHNRYHSMKKGKYK